MRFPEVAYMSWAKALPPAHINLARSGIEACPPSLLKLDPRDLVANLPAGYGYSPLRRAIGRRYGVDPDQVLPLSGGASLANWVACATVLDGAPRGAEVIVERPSYEPLLRIPQALGCRLLRLERRFEDGFGIDLQRFASLVNRKTRLAIVSNLHNPSGARIEPATLVAMAEMLREVGAFLLVDEVYLECLFGRGIGSAVLLAPNVIVSNSLTKAYGLDGLRAGWMLGPEPQVRRAGKIYDLMGVNGVASGELMALAAFRNLAAIRRRSQAILRPNLQTVRRFLAGEERLAAVLPPGGNVLFPRLPGGLTGDRLARHLRERHSTLIVPGSFFESPQHIRLAFGTSSALLNQGLANLRQALNELVGAGSRRRRPPA